GTGREGGLHPWLLLQALLEGLPGDQTGGDHHRRVRGVGARGDRREGHGAVVEDVVLTGRGGDGHRRRGVRRGAAVDVHRTSGRLLVSGDLTGVGGREGVLRLQVDDVVRGPG